MLDLALKSSELALFAPIIERRDQNDDGDSAEDRYSFYPLCF